MRAEQSSVRHPQDLAAEPRSSERIRGGEKGRGGKPEHDDPPVYESTAEFLARHKLLLPFEKEMYQGGELAKTDDEENDGCRVVEIAGQTLDRWSRNTHDITKLSAELTGTDVATN